MVGPAAFAGGVLSAAAVGCTTAAPLDPPPSASSTSVIEAPTQGNCCEN
jgi:hypothetical protein